jgi:hypothetical protein
MPARRVSRRFHPGHFAREPVSSRPQRTPDGPHKVPHQRGFHPGERFPIASSHGCNKFYDLTSTKVTVVFSVAQARASRGRLVRGDLVAGSLCRFS